ncbi:hypothetical protein Bca101_059073 [Brassica carinata]
MVLIYVKCGVWMSSFSDEWSFLADKQRRGRMVTLETSTLLEELKIMVCEDYGVNPNVVNVEFSYEMVNQRGNPPISISNDRQVSNFVGYAKKGSSTTLCVTFSCSGTGAKEKERVNIDLNKEPCDSSNVEDEASKAYRYSEFQERFTEIVDISPALGRYLQEADVRKWARSLFPGSRYDIRTNNPAESINSVLRSPRQFPVIPLLDSIRELLTRWFYERRTLSSKHIDPLTVKVEKKIDRRIVKARGFQVLKVDNFRSLVKGDIYDCHVDLETRRCTCGKFDLGKIPCRHAIPAIYSRGMEVHRFTDGVYSTATWRAAYAESINPIPVPEAEWNVPDEVKLAKVLPPETRKSAGRPVKRRYETVEDKIRSSQGSTKNKKHKCSRCGMEGHKRGTCDIPI